MAVAEVVIEDCHSQEGSGALSAELLPSRAPVFPALPTPVIGRVEVAIEGANPGYSSVA